MSLVRPSLCLWGSIWGQTTCGIFLKFDIGVLCKNCRMSLKVGADLLSDRHTSLEGVNESLPALSIFPDRFGWNSIQEISTWYRWAVVSFGKMGALKNNNWLRDINLAHNLYIFTFRKFQIATHRYPSKISNCNLRSLSEVFSCNLQLPFGSFQL